MPVAEFAFGYASDIRLMELSGTGHPLLSRLMVETPGTFHHSVMVGTLAEAGALAIGANPVLCRVAALYHDVGKLGKAQYFSENQAGAANVHDAHVARALLRGDPVPREGRGPHGGGVRPGGPRHGDHRAAPRDEPAVLLPRQGEADDPGPEGVGGDVPVPGPEAEDARGGDHHAGRRDRGGGEEPRHPSPQEVEETVTGIVNRVYLDGQLNECDMTLRDLHAVGRAISQVLAAVAHGRVDYPEAGKGRRFEAAATG